MFGRSFVNEPMMWWPLGAHGDVIERFTRHFAYFLEDVIDLGVVWEAESALGGSVWFPPGGKAAWDAAQLHDVRTYSLTADRRRYDDFWAWVDAKAPDEPLWFLDSIGVEPSAQREGIGSALMAHGLERVRASGSSAFLETGTAQNVPFYERFGFRVIEDADAPEGGPARLVHALGAHVVTLVFPALA